MDPELMAFEEDSTPPRQNFVMENKMEQKSIFAKFLSAQAELAMVAKDQKAKAGQATYRYADISDVLSMVRPILNRHGLCLIQRAESTESTVSIETFLYDDQGAEIRSGALTVSTAGLMQKGVQAHGSAVTYARRYSLVTFLGVAYGDDDDGQKAVAHDTTDLLTQEDVETAQGIAEQGKDAIKKWVDTLKATRPVAYEEFKRLGWHKAVWARACEVEAIKE